MPNHNRQIDDCVDYPYEKELIDCFIEFLRTNYSAELKSSEIRLSVVKSGMSRVKKLFLYADRIYPYFIKIGDIKNISREDSKYGHAARRIPALSIPPKEHLLRDSTGKYGLIAFRYITGSKKNDPPLTLLSAYREMPIHRFITLIDELYQNVLVEYHNFADASIGKLPVPTINKELFSLVNNNEISIMLEKYESLRLQADQLCLPIGTIHGDLHCENILIGRYYNPIVLDFEMSLEGACLLRDFAEYEIALFYAGAVSQFDETEQSAQVYYQSDSIFLATGVDKFQTTIQRVRANMSNSIMLMKNGSDEIIEDIEVSYRLYLMRYIILYGRIAQLSLTSYQRRSVISLFADVFRAVFEITKLLVKERGAI